MDGSKDTVASKAGRKPKGYELEQKIKVYTDTYDLDDLNQANDMASIRQLASFELIIEKLQAELNKEKDPKVIKDLGSALKDAVGSYNTLMTSLGVNRKQRQSESDESVLSYVEKLKSQAKKMWAARLKVLKCPDCQLPLAKYYVYIQEKGEPGSIAYEGKIIEPIKYRFEVECPKCFKMCSADESDA